MASAIETLGASGRSAVRYGDGWAYYEQGARGWYAVSEADVADLDERIAAGEPDAYSRWCADTMAEDLTASLCHSYEAEHPRRVPGADLRSIVARAMLDGGPTVTVAEIHAIVLSAEDEAAS